MLAVVVVVVVGVAAKENVDCRPVEEVRVTVVVDRVENEKREVDVATIVAVVVVARVPPNEKPYEI